MGHLVDLLHRLDVPQDLHGGFQHKQSRAGAPWKVVEMVTEMLVMAKTV